MRYVCEAESFAGCVRFLLRWILFFAVVTLSCVYSYGVCVAAYFTGSTIFIFHEFLSYYCTAGLPGGAPVVGTLRQKMFPSIAPVAQQVFGNQAAAAQIERDFSACGNLLTKSRSRMDTFWVEHVMFCKANFDLIPALKNIPIIAAKDIRKCLPACFKGDNTDLLAAKAAFDVLNNTAIPTEDGIDLDG